MKPDAPRPSHLQVFQFGQPSECQFCDVVNAGGQFEIFKPDGQCSKKAFQVIKLYGQLKLPQAVQERQPLGKAIRLFEEEGRLYGNACEVGLIDLFTTQ